jgi:heme o synthase
MSEGIAKTRSVPAAYLELAKPRIVTMVLVTTLLGYAMAGGGFEPLYIAWLLIGTAMVAGGAAALNNYLERDADARMHRTRNRPIPSGQIPPIAALNYGAYLVLAGTILLGLQVNLLTAHLGLLSAFLYALVYTPLKRLSWWNTPVGAIPGAIPPLMGWAGATGSLSLGAWVLFGILFIWQHPHFYAIAWMFREDYARGGFKVLPVVYPDGKRTFRQILVYSLLLVPVSLLPTLIGMSGWLYFAGSLAVGLFMLSASVALVRSHSFQDARNVLRASIIYLPVLMGLIVLDIVVGAHGGW